MLAFLNVYQTTLGSWSARLNPSLYPQGSSQDILRSCLTAQLPCRHLSLLIITVHVDQTASFSTLHVHAPLSQISPFLNFFFYFQTIKLNLKITYTLKVHNIKTFHKSQLVHFTNNMLNILLPLLLPRLQLSLHQPPRNLSQEQLDPHEPQRTLPPPYPHLHTSEQRLFWRT